MWDCCTFPMVNSVTVHLPDNVGEELCMCCCDFITTTARVLSINEHCSKVLYWVLEEENRGRISRISREGKISRKISHLEMKTFFQLLHCCRKQEWT